MGVQPAPRRAGLRSVFVTGVALAVLTASGVLGVSPAAAATDTYVRLAQLTEDTAGTELVVSSVTDGRQNTTIPGVGYGAVSAYQRVEPGSYVVGLRAAGSDGLPLVSASLDAMVGSAYTLAVVGDATDRAITIIIDDLAPPAPGLAKMRVIHAAPSAPELDVRGPAGEPLALGLMHGRAGDYGSTPAGELVLSVGGPPGGGPTELPVTVGANQVVSVVLTSRGGALAAAVHVDADGPPTVPPGPVHAGLGGEWEKPGGPAATVLLAVLAVAAAGLSAHLSHRARTGRRPSA